MMNRIIIAILLSAVFAAPVKSQDDFSTDKQLGAEGALQVEQMMGTYPDSALNEYVSQIGNRLAKSLGTIPFEFRFHVVDMPEPNAFALPGGYIYISRGILSLINEEDELAGVMGHEMIHVTKRHSVKQMKKGILPAILRIPGALVGIFNPDLGRVVNTPVNFGSALFLSSYSRKQESEADELGIELSSEAGYDPAKLSGVLQHLAAEMENQSGEEEKKSYFSTHPYTPKRVEDIDEKAPSLSWQSQPPIYDKDGIYRVLDGMILGPNPAQGVFEEEVFRHPDLNFAMTFPKEWNTMNVPVALLATQPDGNAQIYLGGENPGYKPDSLGELTAEMLVEKYEIKPYQNESLKINGYDAYVVAFKDLSGKQPVDIQMYWVHTGDLLANILCMGYDSYSQTMSVAAKSLRPLTDDEHGNFKAVRLRVAEAREGESLEMFSKRTENSWDVKTTALMNDLEENATMKQGQLLKIAKAEAYVIKK